MASNVSSIEKLEKHEPDQNLVYTLVPLEQMVIIEKEIKLCLLELVRVPDINQKSTESLVLSKSSPKESVGTTVYVPIVKL